MDILHKKALILLRLGRYDEVLSNCDEIEEIDEEGKVAGQVGLARCFALYFKGSHRHSLATAKGMLEECGCIGMGEFTGEETDAELISNYHLICALSYLQICMESQRFQSFVEKSNMKSEWPYNRVFVSPNEAEDPKNEFTPQTIEKLKGNIIFILKRELNFLLCHID
jgi:hypothetical protein